jgi:splicing suppressor protein 51
MKSWRDYYTIMSTQVGIEHLITAVLDPIPNQEDPIDKIVDMSNALKAGTDKLSMILSIFAALEVVFPPTSPTLPSSGLQEKQHITLHLIGATAKELDALMLFEELLHLLPNLRSIHCDFIGLELPRPVDDGTITLSCCEACTSLKCTRSMSMFKGSYTEFIRAQQVFKKPDLAVLFHTGHSQESVEEWKPAVQFLATAGFPSMFTCFNGKEMEEETAGLKSIGAKFLVEGCENRWRGLRPLLEVAEETEGATFFMNGFWYVIKGET